ncbi:MFS transporter [Pseudomonas nabeulensis]|uniref:MFS transporter n=1 Tax=Pseudomonas nabeulensis TaxID=2293833 RepID=A0A4Z0ALQ3_9PSED|nr:MFS transporter [Pseudomonas nabeulensis]TFY87702.1 MFS transporter [Pseudomonas nabeulensis]
MQRLLVLMLGAFVAQTTEYLPIGLLSRIAEDLGVSEARTGTLVTGYAWVAAITAIPFTLAAQRIPRRILFLGLLGIISATNALAAFATTLPLLISLRLVTALTHGVFWSMIAAYAVRLYPDMPASRATAWVLGGISLALVVGGPIATAIGQWMGWRFAFTAYFLLGCATLWLEYQYLPQWESDSSLRQARGSLQGTAILYLAALVSMLAVTAHFVGYTYVVPILKGVSQLPEVQHALVLMVFGIAGAVGTWLAGWLSVKPFLMALLATVGVASSQAFILFLNSAEIWIWLEMALWGMSVAILIVGLQSWVIEIAPDRADVASSLYVAAFNLGIGSGALFGGIALSNAGSGAALMTGAMLGGLASLTFVGPWGIQRRRRTAA